MSRRPDADPARSAGAAEAWRKRRRRDYNSALAILAGPHTVERHAELARAAYVVSQALAEHLPPGPRELPRGYRLTTNGLGDPAIALGETIFNPAFGSFLPSRCHLALFAIAIKRGWIQEVLDATGASLDFKSSVVVEKVR